MGRYITGGDFEYKYALGEQHSDLVYLADLSGAGSASLAFRLTGDELDEVFLKPEDTPVAGFEDPFDVFERRASEVLTLMRSGPNALRRVLERPIRKLAGRISIEAEALYTLEREEHPRLLAWINTYLPAHLELTLEDLAQDPEEDEESKVALALGELGPAVALHSCADIGLWLLSYAVRSDEDKTVVGDSDPTLSATLWNETGAVDALVVDAACRASRGNDGPSFERSVVRRLAQRAASESAVLVTSMPSSPDDAEALDKVSTNTAATYLRVLAPYIDRALSVGSASEALMFALAGLEAVAPALAEAATVRALARRAFAAHEERAPVPPPRGVWPLVTILSGSAVEVGARVLLRLRSLGADADLLELLQPFFRRKRKMAAHVAELRQLAKEDAGKTGALAAFLLGGRALYRERPGPAATWLKRALDRPLPEGLRVSALLARAEALQATNRPRRALTVVNEALALNPRSARAHFRRGTLVDQLGRPRQAINAYNRAIEIAPWFASAWFNRACEQGLLGRADRAVRDLCRAIELDPSAKVHAREDSYFDPIRMDPAFAALLE